MCPQGQKEAFMYCRHCGTELEKGAAACPNCGKSCTQRWQMIIAISVAVLVLAALAALLFFGLDLDFLKKTPATTPPVTEQGQQNPVEDITEQTPEVEPYESEVDFSGDEESTKTNLEAVVATVNGKSLTNRLLQFYFNLEVSNFVNANYSYLTELGFDYSRPLNEQKCYDADMSWEAYFVVKAITAWQQYEAVRAMAESEGFKLSDEKLAEIAQIEETMEKYAEEAKAESVDKWLQSNFLAEITKEEYMAYTELMAICTEYVLQKTGKEPTLEEMETYYNENISYFDDMNVTMNSGPLVDVRHILLQPEGTVDGSDTSACTKEAWDACLTKAEELLQQWKDSGATEAKFAELANANSADGGSNTTGGLYQNISAETQFVEPFLLWAIDDKRQVGDTGIVKTDFGYHIMYFSAGQELWEYYARNWIVEDREIALLEKAVEAYPSEIVTDAICIREFIFE